MNASHPDVSPNQRPDVARFEYASCPHPISLACDRFLHKEIRILLLVWHQTRRDKLDHCNPRIRKPLPELSQKYRPSIKTKHKRFAEGENTFRSFDWILLCR